MYMYIYVYNCVHMYTRKSKERGHMYEYIYKCMCAYIYVCIYMYTYIYVYACKSTELGYVHAKGVIFAGKKCDQHTTIIYLKHLCMCIYVCISHVCI